MRTTDQVNCINEDNEDSVHKFHNGVSKGKNNNRDSNGELSFDELEKILDLVHSKEDRILELENALRESVTIVEEREAVLQEEEARRKQIMEKVRNYQWRDFLGPTEDNLEAPKNLLYFLGASKGEGPFRPLPIIEEVLLLDKICFKVSKLEQRLLSLQSAQAMKCHSCKPLVSRLRKLESSWENIVADRRKHLKDIAAMK